MSDVLVGSLLGLLPLGVLGLRWLATKTKTKIDDAVVEYVDRNLPWVRKQLEQRLADEKSQPREKRIDHRK